MSFSWNWNYPIIIILLHVFIFSVLTGSLVMFADSPSKRQCPDSAVTVSTGMWNDTCNWVMCLYTGCWCQRDETIKVISFSSVMVTEMYWWMWDPLICTNYKTWYGDQKKSRIRNLLKNHLNYHKGIVDCPVFTWNDWLWHIVTTKS